MPVLTILPATITNGQDVVLPWEAVGSIAAGPNPPNVYNLTAASRQIDDNALIGLPVPPPVQNGTNLPVNFDFELTTADCPDLNTWYMLTIYAWDSEGDCTIQAVTFKRVAPPGGGGGGPPPPPGLPPP